MVATTPSLMKLFEQGKLRINDPVTAYLPEFQGGHSDITVRDLMTHFSGLPPDLDLEPAWSGYETGIRRALVEKPMSPPATRFVYSDINFELLGEIVHRLSGKPLDEYAREAVFAPLGMKETGFHPAASLRARIAPTEIDAATGAPFRGVVHDPTARYMGGVAGHAGVFSTADDLAKYAQMLLDGGGKLFSPLTVKKFTSPNSPPDQPILRGLGWDIDSGLFGAARRAVSHRLLRAHRLHGTVAVDRSGLEDLRHPDDQFGASQGRQESESAAVEDCDGGGRGRSAWKAARRSTKRWKPQACAA